MQIAHDGSSGNYPDAGIETGHPSPMSRMSWNEAWMTLFGPEAFQIGASGDGGVGLIVHGSKVGDNEEVGTTEERYDGARCRLQDWMLMVRLQDSSLIKERSSRPPDHSPPITQPSYLIGPLNSLTSSILFPTSQGPLSYSGNVFSHNPPRFLLPPVCRYCSFFIVLVRRPTSSPIFI